MGERLSKQPLVEALCELRFRPSEKWDMTLPGLFYAEVKEEFPEQTTLAPVAVQIAIANNPVNLPQPTELLPRLQFKRHDKSAVVQVGSDLLVVNHLQPYTSWEEFRALIIKMLSKYVKLVGDLKLERIGLRYINHISAPDSKFDIEDFLSICPIFPSPLNRDLVGFNQNYTFQYTEPQSILKHNTGVIQNSDGKFFVLLDLDFISQEIEPDMSEPFDWIQSWLNQAHNYIESAFIASLNPNYYESIK